MIVNEIKGNLFDNLEPGDAIGHGANCRGLMGAGVAKPIHDNYPFNFEVYKFLCDSGKFVPGDCLVVPDGEHTIFNLATQNYPGKHAQYDYVKKSAQEMSSQASKIGITKIKTVRIGSGIGGLDWNTVKTILEKVPGTLELEVYYL